MRQDVKFEILDRKTGEIVKYLMSRPKRTSKWLSEVWDGNYRYEVVNMITGRCCLHGEPRSKNT